MFEAAESVNTRDAFQEIGSGLPQVVPTPEGLAPNDTRYAFVPIWGITGTPATAFRSDLAGSKFIPFRPFPFPLTNENNQIVFQERRPAEQIIDLQKLANDRPFVEFKALALLRDEAKARQIVSSLTNPNSCVKYPRELLNTCSTCWISYLEADSTAKSIVDRFTADEQMLYAALETREQLVNVLQRGLDYGAKILNEALKAIDDPKSGKDSLVDVDYAYLWNLHQDPPQYRTSVSNESIASEMAKAFATVLRDQVATSQVGEAPIDHKQVQTMIAQAMNPLVEQNRLLQERLALYEPTPDAAPAAENPTKEKSNAKGKDSKDDKNNG